MPPHYSDRFEAGRRLGAMLPLYAGDPAVVILGVGGDSIPVAYEVAQALAAPLDVLCVRPLRLKGGEVVGALATGVDFVADDEADAVLRRAGTALDAAVDRESGALRRDEIRFHGRREAVSLAGLRVVLVDDGTSPPVVLRAALRSVTTRGASSVTVVSAASNASSGALAGLVRDVVAPALKPAPGPNQELYHDATRPTDEAVIDLLERSRRPGFALELPTS